MLAHLELINDFTHSERNLVFAFKRAIFPLRSLYNLVQFPLCSFKKFTAFTGHVLGPELGFYIPPIAPQGRQDQ